MFLFSALYIFRVIKSENDVDMRHVWCIHTCNIFIYKPQEKILLARVGLR
jgi:hypothetical protein